MSEPLVDIVLEDDRWEAVGLEALSDRAVRAALAELGLGSEGFQIVVMGCDDARIAALNADFRGKPTPTNVLSWPADDLSPGAAGQMPLLPEAGETGNPEALGDIALAWETCAREAVEQDKPMADHVTHLVVHGFLHCLGYDHVDDADAAVMEGCEVRILASLGLSDPYS